MLVAKLRTRRILREKRLQAVYVGAERAIWIFGYPAFFNKLNSLDIFAESILS